MRKKETATNPPTLEYQLDPPTFYESQLFPNGLNCNDDDNGSFLDMCSSYMVAFSGPRGGGKTASLAYAAIKARAAGLQVWLNFPLEFFVIRDLTGNKKREFLKAELLDLKEFLSMKKPLKGGLIGLDEYQDIASNYSFNSTKNRLLAAIWAQIRKFDLSFYYTSKFHKWVDTRTRDELDIEIACVDASRTPWGRKKYHRGEMIFWQLQDWSGMLTGYQYEQYPISRPMKFFCKPVWGAYPTRFKIDIFEAMRGVKLDLEKDVISDKFETEDTDWTALINTARSLFDRQVKWNPADFWQELGIFERSEKAVVKKVLRDNIGLSDGSNPNHPVFQIVANPIGIGFTHELSVERELVGAV